MKPEPTAGTSSAPAARFELAELQTASATDVGRVRSVNQDCFGEFEDPESGVRLLFVADGMGGHRAGEVASQLAVECVGEVFRAGEQRPGELLQSALELANARIFEAASQDHELAGMGTTGVALILSGEPRSWIAHVGDSRAYRLRDGVFTQLSADHSVVGELVRRGQLTAEEARVHPQSNEILRALGTQDDVDVELTPVDVRAGDRFLLCSDGLSGMLPDARIAEVLGREEPSQAIRTLVEESNEAGGTDNITVMIAVIPGPSAGDTGQAVGGAPLREESKEQGGAGTSSVIRWVVVLVLLAALLLFFLGGPDSGG